MEIDAQHIAEPGLVVLDVTAADEETVWLRSLLGAAFVRQFGQQLRILRPVNVHEK
ncbi:DUF6207 family protein [Streptomyces sp. NPDC003036]|uniref:DUF6207 family protein n=1 Tax=Streptomyces sp. NPDC003036 TaxID=3154442 RepID=UPI0033AD5D34